MIIGKKCVEKLDQYLRGTGSPRSRPQGRGQVVLGRIRTSKGNQKLTTVELSCLL